MTLDEIDDGDGYVGEMDQRLAEAERVVRQLRTTGISNHRSDGASFDYAWHEEKTLLEHGFTLKEYWDKRLEGLLSEDAFVSLFESHLYSAGRLGKDMMQGGRGSVAAAIRVALDAARREGEAWLVKDSSGTPSVKMGAAVDWLRASARFRDRVPTTLLRAVDPAAALAAAAGTTAVYLSPFMRLMLDATRDFGMPLKKPKAEHLRDYFIERGPSAGLKISAHLAQSMATLVRDPNAMRGGNKRSEPRPT